jgi:signal transduction histidine kinase
MAGDLQSSEQRVQLDAVALNEKLLLSLVRQHELTEIAQRLNEQLQAEIAARKRAEEALISSEKLASVGRMSAVLAHEINNPLEAVTNLLYIARTADELSDVRNYLETADAELKRIAHITRQTLGFYREAAAPVTFLVTALLNSVIDLLNGRIVARQANIIVLRNRELEITAFQGELRQVFSNLLRNSLDAIPVAGTIILRATSSNSLSEGCPCVRVTISDNGHGIGPSALSNIFEPFFTTKGTVGNGLGLWVSKQIIEKHGGRIEVRSRTSGPYQGTTFFVVLPVDSSSRTLIVLRVLLTGSVNLIEPLVVYGIRASLQVQQSCILNKTGVNVISFVSIKNLVR